MSQRHKIILVIGLTFFVAGLVLYFWFDGGPQPAEEATNKSNTVKVYFSNKIVDPGAKQCDMVSYTRRQVDTSKATQKTEEGELLYLALTELFKGPTEIEKNEGFYTSINSDVKVQDILIENKTATIDFSQELNTGVAGSCRVMAIRSQIENTVLQFDGIDKVIISVNGNSQEILQP